MAIDGALRGTHIFIAGGTGVFPYLDFTFYIIRHMINKISRTKFNENRNKIDDIETFGDIQDDFKLILFFSYTNLQSSVMNEVLKQAKDFDLKYNLNIFDYNMRTNQDKYWDSSFFIEKLKTYSDSIDKVSLCGPVGFMEAMKNSIIKTKIVDVKKIIFI